MMIIPFVPKMMRIMKEELPFAAAKTHDGAFLVEKRYVVQGRDERRFATKDWHHVVGLVSPNVTLLASYPSTFILFIF